MIVSIKSFVSLRSLVRFFSDGSDGNDTNDHMETRLKSVIVRNLSESFLGTTPIGDVRKFGSGGTAKGPETRFSFSSARILSNRTPGCEDADFKFLLRIEIQGLYSQC